MNEEVTGWTTVCLAGALALLCGCTTNGSPQARETSELHSETALGDTLEAALDDLKATAPEAPSEAEIAAAKDPKRLLGRWEIVEHVSRTGSKPEGRSKPGIRVYWVFEADGSMRIEGPTTSDARYLYTGDRLLVFGLGPKQDYRIVRFEEHQLEASIEIRAGSIDIENRVILKRSPKPTAAPPMRAATDEERALAGTWVAVVDERGTTTRSMHGMALIELSGDDAAGASKGASCIWLELFENLSGFRSECMIVNGEPTALAATHPLTGKKSPLGVAFHWSAQGRTVNIELESPLTVPKPGGALEAKKWDLTLPAEWDSSKVAIRERFPEHGYELPVQSEWTIFPGSYLD